MPPSSFRPRAARLVEVTLARPLVPWFACARLKTAPIDPPTRFSSSSSSPTRHFPLSLSPSFFPHHAPSPLFRERNTRTQDPARYEPDLRRILRVPPLSIVVPATSTTSFCYIRVVSLVVPSFLPEAYPAYPREFGREGEGRGGGFTKKKRRKKRNVYARHTILHRTTFVLCGEILVIWRGVEVFEGRRGRWCSNHGFGGENYTIRREGI